jgi:hypothetical protein
MAATFEHQGVRFLYPENWSLQRDVQQSGWSVSVESPETAFLTLVYRAGDRDIAAIADSALEALREEYPVLESDPALETLAGQPAVGYDVRFYSLDLTNTAWIRSLACEDGCVLILCQINDLELSRNGPVLKAICASLRVDD